jgi:esterase/lipase
MMRKFLAALLIVIATLAACAPAATPPPSPTETSTPLPVATATPHPTATRASTATGKRTVTFTTADGVTLNGTLYGQGSVAVIFSTMGAQKQETWATAAQAIAERGYLALTYNFRYWVTDTRMDDGLRDKAADDLIAALAFVREQGLQEVVLVGASLGGIASAKVAATELPAAVAIIAAPLGQVGGLALRVEPEDIRAIAAPKLFIDSEDDEAGFADDIQRMFEIASEPKEIHLYPGSAHGTDLFQTEYGSDLTQRLITFIETHAPPPTHMPLTPEHADADSRASKRLPCLHPPSART